MPLSPSKKMRTSGPPGKTIGNATKLAAAADDNDDAQLVRQVTPAALPKTAASPTVKLEALKEDDDDYCVETSPLECSELGPAGAIFEAADSTSTPWSADEMAFAAVFNKLQHKNNVKTLRSIDFDVYSVLFRGTTHFILSVLPRLPCALLNPLAHAQTSTH